MQCLAFIHIKADDIPNIAVDSTETLREKAEIAEKHEKIAREEEVKIADKIDDMVTEEENSDATAGGVIKFIGDVVRSADTLPMI